MIKTISLPAICMSIGLFAAGIAPAHASAIPSVTQPQVDALRSGESARDVIASLGKPEYRPKWLDGTHSLVYELKDLSTTADGPMQVFVNLDATNHMIGVEEVSQQ